MKMKTMRGLVAMILITAAVLGQTGCASGPGPAETTLRPMKNVGPLVSYERETVLDGTNVVKSTIIEKIESPEVGQLKLKLEELKQRGSVPSGVNYWWHQHNHLAPVPVYGGYIVGSGGSY